MHRLSKIRLMAAALLTVAVPMIASVAIAAPPDRAEVNFEELSASGITGNLRMQQNAQQNWAFFRGTITGLEPNTEYTLVFYQNETCSAQTSDLGVEAHTFTANANGEARLNVKLDESTSWDIDSWTFADLGSISIRAANNGTTALACGAVNELF